MADHDNFFGEESIGNVKTFQADNIILDVNKITQRAFNPSTNVNFYTDEPVKIAMEHRGSNKPINALVTINFDFDGMKEKGLSIFGPEKLAPFDRIVLDAINTLLIEGKNRYITLNMIYHVITGSEDKMISPKYAREINNSITKMMFTHIVIRADEEAIMYKGLKDFYYDSAILPAERVTAILNGNEVACIRIDRNPPLLVYANTKNQIARVSKELMKLPFAKEKRETKNYMTLVFYLLRRIVAIRRTSNAILYDTLYKDLGYENESKQNKLAIRKKVKEILEAWTNAVFGKTKIIGYEEKKKHGMPYEVVIDYEILTEETKDKHTEIVVFEDDEEANR